MSVLLNVYHRLPSWACSCAASLHGYWLRHLRYGQETERLVGEAIEQESWSSERRRVWEQERLAMVLDRAARQVPYYREQWRERRRAGDGASHELLQNWPILDKEPLRQAPRSFIADDCNVRLHLVQTSGTSGTPLQLWQSRETMVAWYALVEARSRRWYGVRGDDRWAILGGRLVAPVGRNRPPFWVWNRGLRQLYMSSYHLATAWIGHYLDALNRYDITYIWGYTSALYTLAQEILRLNRTDIRMKVVITNAEPLYQYQRETISAAFQCPVRETYGMAEMVAAAGECERGRMHLWPSVGIVEACENDRHVSTGETGDLVCTGLINTDMPLIRYRVRDRGALSTRESGCDCGRTLPVLDLLEGRTDDCVYTADGRRVGRLDPILKGDLPVKEMQIIQETLDSLRVRYVPAPGFDARSERQILQRLQAYVGTFRIDMEPVDHVPRGKNGKFRAVVSNLTAEQREMACRNS